MVVAEKFKAANPDNDGTVDKKEPNSAAARNSSSSFTTEAAQP